MSQTCDQKCFTILEVAADWHELMIPQRTMRQNWTHGLQLADIPLTPISPKPVSYYSFPVPRRVKGCDHR